LRKEREKLEDAQMELELLDENDNVHRRIGEVSREKFLKELNNRGAHVTTVLCISKTSTGYGVSIERERKRRKQVAGSRRKIGEDKS